MCSIAGPLTIDQYPRHVTTFDVNASSKKIWFSFDFLSEVNKEVNE
jgi:hypothetical protein